MPKIISVHSFRAGTGKSYMTANLAALFACSGLRVGVIDTDIQSPGIRVLLGLDAQKIEPAYDDNAWTKRRMSDAACDVTDNLGGPITGKVFLVPFSIRASNIGSALRDGDDVGLLSDGVNDLVSDLKLDILLIDTHPGIHEETLLPISVSDALVIILRPDMQDFQGTAVTVDVARKLELKTMVLLLNEVPAAYNTLDVRARVEEAYNCEVAAALPHSDELMALASGEIFALKYPDNPLTAGLKTLVARLLQ